MSTHDDAPQLPEPRAPEPLRLNWFRNRRAVTLAILASWSGLGIVFATHTGTVPERLLTACGVQLLIIAIVLPAVSAGGRRTFDVLCRGGSVNDAFGAGVLVVAAITAKITLIEALQVYLLMSTVGLVCLGVYCWVRGTGQSTARTAGITAVVGLAIWAGPFTATGAGFDPQGLEGQTVGVRMLANADLHAAFSACLGLADSPVPWYGVLLVYVAAAGLVWSGSLILAGGAQPADRRDNTA